jgi:hypothetical protein
MSKATKFKKGTPQLAFKDIWRHHPELQNWSSSSWWFFLLLPKQEQGYGPKQMMFTFASRVGELIKVNQTWQKGIDPERKVGKKEEFMTTVVGWINDGKNGCEHVVDQAALAKLSYSDQSLQAWSEDDNELSYGGGIKATNNSSFEIEAHFKGRKGEGRFTIWSAGDSEIDTPQIQYKENLVGLSWLHGVDLNSRVSLPVQVGQKNILESGTFNVF